MFGGHFNTIGSFTDPTAASVDPGSGAWSVQAVGNLLFVTWADPFSPVSGPHGGVVDVFDTDGHLLTPNHFAANAPGEGPLENPWGITQAPANFGAYSNDLLIGNVAGAGNINVFNPFTSAYLGKLDQPDGTPVAITGLWDLEFGDGTPHGGKTNQLFFDAGPNAPGVSGFGLFGVIQPAGHEPGRHPGSGHLSDALPIDVLDASSGAQLCGVPAQPATSPIPAPEAGALGSSQAVPPVSTPAGSALGLAAYWVRDRVFADLEGIQWLALSPTAEPLWS
jgi:prepilin-type processing-associated H-X9-DG protein